MKQKLKIWIETLTEVLIEAGIEPKLAIERSQNLIMEIQGALILVRILDDTEPFQRLIDNLAQKLLFGGEN